MTPEALALLATAAEGALAAAGYGVLVYARHRNDEPFEPPKFLATVVTGALLGAALAASGRTVSLVAIEDRLAMYAGVLVFVEGLLKWGEREYERRYDDA